MPNPFSSLPLPLVLAAAVLLSGDRPEVPGPSRETEAPIGPAIRIEPSPPGPARAALARRLAEWHPVYLRALEPLRRARLALADALARRSLAAAAPECEALGRAVEAVEPGVLPSCPDHRLRLALRGSLDRYLAASAACAGGDLLAAHDLLIEADLQFRAARRLVERLRAGPVPLAAPSPEAQ